LEPKKIEVIPLGIDHTTYTPHSTNDERFLGPLGLPDRFLLYPAALLPHKNHHALIEALALLADRDIALVLTGPDRGRLSNLKACARRMHVEHRVRHLGYVSDLELASLYRQATLLVFPSLYEGFGAPPIEAMACGCPVAVSRETSLPEVCGNAAVYFDARRPEDIAATVDTALGDAALRQSLTHRGLERAARFTWEAAAARHALVYRRAIVEQLDFPGPSA
jgi:glycosyltransferase involved in cell wall biosynthesis